MRTTPTSPAKPLTTAQMIRLVWELGYIIALPAALFGFGGAYLDKNLGTSPFYAMLGLILAFGISATIVINLVQRLFTR